MLTAMSSTLAARIAAIASCHHGLISRQQAYELGASKHYVECQLRSGAWRRLHADVYVVGGAPETHARKLVAACYAAEDAVASHRAGGWVWRSDGFLHP